MMPLVSHSMGLQYDHTPKLLQCARTALKAPHLELRGQYWMGHTGVGIENNPKQWHCALQLPPCSPTQQKTKHMKKKIIWHKQVFPQTSAIKKLNQLQHTSVQQNLYVFFFIKKASS